MYSIMFQAYRPGSRVPEAPWSPGPGQAGAGRGWRCAGGGAASAGRTATVFNLQTPLEIL